MEDTNTVHVSFSDGEYEQLTKDKYGSYAKGCIVHAVVTGHIFVQKFKCANSYDPFIGVVVSILP